MVKVRGARTHRWSRAVAGATAVVVATALLSGASGAGTPRSSPARVASATKPTRGGSVTYGLEAETNGGWCIPQAQLAISRAPLAPSLAALSCPQEGSILD